MGKRLPRKKPAVKRKAAKRVRENTQSRSRSQAAKRGWETRKKREAEQQATRTKRAQASKRGWTTRRATALEDEGLHPASAEALSDLSAKQLQFLHNMRLAVFGYQGYSQELTGRNPSGLEILRTMVQQRDNRWQTFTEFAEKAGFSSKQARTAFFSPSAKRMAVAHAPGIRP